MADRDNYYILTGVSFDPIETNEATIKAAVAVKQQEWSKNQNNPLKRNKALENLRLLKDIEAVLLDPNQRKQEAAEAISIRNSQYSKLDEKIKITEAKGYIKPKELESLVKKFGEFGIPDSEIKKRISKPISETKPVISEETADLELIDNQMASQIEKNFKQLGGVNNTLYSFLRMNESSSPSQLIDAAETKRKTLGSRAEKTGNLNAELELAGICLIVFKDKVSKKKYDNYVSVTKYTELNEAIKEGAINNKKIVNQELMETLLDLAVSKYGIRITEASAYIKKFCIINGYQVSDGSKVNCGLCASENPANAVTCSKCSKPLAIECPSCNVKNGNAAEKCAKCGFDLTKMNLAIELIINAKKSLNEKRLDDALKFISEAKIYWPNHREIIEIEKEATEQKKYVGSAISSIMEDIQAKNYYSAHSKIIQAKNSGLPLEQTIIQNVENTIKNVESRLGKIKSATKDDAFLQIVSLTTEIKDSVEVNNLLKKYPPEPAKDLICTVKGTEVLLSWASSDSVGELEYVLIRKSNSYANDIDDGEVIYRGKEVSFSDRTLSNSIEYCYMVFVARLDVYSNGCKGDKTVVILPPLQGIKAIGGDGIVTLSWETPSTLNEVKVWKGRSEDRPETIQQCESVICNRLDGMVVQNLENGKKQWFFIIAYHNINGKVYPADSIVLSAVPEKPAKPLEDFNVESKGQYYTATWINSNMNWDPILFYSQTKLDFINDKVYNLDHLLVSCEKINMQMKSLNEAEFELNFIGECYVIPGVINSTNVIVNTPISLSNMPNVEQVSFDTNAAGSELYINFNWPKKITKVAVIYRQDAYPEGPKDPLGKYIECTKQQYDFDAAVLLQNPTKAIYYTSIYTIFESNNKKTYSSGIQAEFNNEPQKDIQYSFKYKKGFLSKKHTLTLTVQSEGAFVLPNFVLSSKLRSMPLTKDDGYIIATVTEETKINGSYTFTFNVDAIQSDTCIKMFFVNDKHYKRYRLLNQGSAKV